MWFRNFFLLFIVLAVAEIYVLLSVGSLIGALPTIGLILLTGIIGVGMLKQQGFSVFARLQEKMRQGQAPAQEMVEGVLLIIAGAFLVTPGFVTDTIGFLWLIPQTREYFAKLLISKGMFKVQSMHGGGFTGSGNDPFGQQRSYQDDNTVDGEYERTDDKEHKRLEE
ncbi:FxsA family protein [Kangiella geojedonensis]|uniref:FxsA cytoplasmic membrane protein n=1 Tax=Kangiella geojedonensis TaxID=914150 RepID=A0A0F6TSF2_9GAMM|nr:FxsA family protein [Kangiella geojedonensis]AKE53019.1 FxsA cytoplasmic membrane protein [Kangiella geojedonensis]